MTRLITRAGHAALLLVLVTWILSLISGYDVVADVHPNMANQLPSASAILGRDHMGRNVAWRMILASQAFVGPGLLAALVALALGLPTGALSGYRGGWAAAIIRYLWAVTAAVPRFILVLLACSIYGSTAAVLASAAGVAFAPALGEAIHTRISELRSKDFVLATRAHGVSPWRTVGWHLLWVSCRALVFRQILFLFSFVLVLETSLSYIGGFGIEEPQPSWGNMLAFEFGLHGGNPWAWAAPAAAIWLTAAAAIGTASTLKERGRG